LLPIHTTASKDEFFKDGPYTAYFNMGSKPDVYYAAFSPYNYEAWGPYQKSIDSDIQKYLMGQMKAEDLLKKSADYWNAAKAAK